MHSARNDSGGRVSRKGSADAVVTQGSRGDPGPVLCRGGEDIEVGAGAGLLLQKGLADTAQAERDTIPNDETTAGQESGQATALEPLETRGGAPPSGLEGGENATASRVSGTHWGSGAKGQGRTTIRGRSGRDHFFFSEKIIY